MIVFLKPGESCEVRFVLEGDAVKDPDNAVLASQYAYVRHIPAGEIPLDKRSRVYQNFNQGYAAMKFSTGTGTTNRLSLHRDQIYFPPRTRIMR
jgi:hypothetical protein